MNENIGELHAELSSNGMMNKIFNISYKSRNKWDHINFTNELNELNELNENNLIDNDLRDDDLFDVGQLDVLTPQISTINNKSGNYVAQYDMNGDFMIGDVFLNVDMNLMNNIETIALEICGSQVILFDLLTNLILLKSSNSNKTNPKLRIIPIGISFYKIPLLLFDLFKTKITKHYPLYLTQYQLLRIIITYKNVRNYALCEAATIEYYKHSKKLNINVSVLQMPIVQIIKHKKMTIGSQNDSYRLSLNSPTKIFIITFEPFQQNDSTFEMMTDLYYDSLKQVTLIVDDRPIIYNDDDIIRVPFDSLLNCQSFIISFDYKFRSFKQLHGIFTSMNIDGGTMNFSRINSTYIKFNLDSDVFKKFTVTQVCLNQGLFTSGMFGLIYQS